MSPKELTVALVSAVFASLALIAIAQDSWKGAVACVVALELVIVALVIRRTRERKIAGKNAKVLARIERALAEISLEHIEKALENVSLRVVTESQATQRELGGRLDDLGRALDKDF